MIQKIELTREIAKQNMHDCNANTQFYYDRKAAYPKYTVGQKVLLYDPVNKKGICKKLRCRWTGPYWITAAHDGYVYKLRRCDNGQEVKALVHSNRLRSFNESRDLFYTRNPPSADTDTDTDTDTQQQTATPNDPSPQSTGLDDGCYEIDHQPKNDSRKTTFLSTLEKQK